MNETICAISTAAGNGAIAVIRLSGKDAFSIANKLFYSVKAGLKLAEQTGQRVYFGTLI